MEEWKDIQNYEGYQASNMGRVRDINKGIILTQYNRNKLGYKAVTIGGKPISVHRLVAQAFIPNPNNLPMVNHKDETPSNNCVENLEWCDAKYNCNYGTLQERRIRKVFKPILQYTKNGVFLKEWESIISAAQQTNISRKHISDCCCGRGKTAGGYIWKHKEVA